ncbi:MAG: DUF4202 domain-containing protein [Chloroflexi bacterium]|nr:DUF4202 domain-containing protein [Chloroflexota bacterium]MYD17805.1 DUF4202 domain-containing protein [Chloroflexota bacterium]MYJ02401.1 DUF4202 domain-containing protein [Chloroflexota bacterium]
MTGDERFERAIAAIDAANADDPFTLTIEGVALPKEQTHAEMMTRWVSELDPQASEELLLAARAHHIRRWMIPRSTFPAGRSAYLRWRRALHSVHAELTAAILEECGYARRSVERVAALVAKADLLQAGDSDAQTLEDALSLVFLDTQLEPLLDDLDDRQLRRALGRTWRKMSPNGQAAARRLTLSQRAVEALTRLVDGFADE